MVKHNTPDVVCMRVERVSNIITQLQKAMDMGYKSRKSFDNAVCEIIFLADAYNN